MCYELVVAGSPAVRARFPKRVFKQRASAARAQRQIKEAASRENLYPGAYYIIPIPCAEALTPPEAGRTLTGAFAGVFGMAGFNLGSSRGEHIGRLEFWVSQLRDRLETAKHTRSKSPGAIGVLVELEIAKAHVAAESDGAGQFEKWAPLLREGAAESMRLHKLLGVI